jgi:RND family efflux transporter MFP subunit
MFLKKHWWKIGICLLALIAIVGFIIRSHSAPVTDATTDTIPVVSVATAAELSSQVAPLSVVGTVQSKAQATVAAQSSGQVIGVYKQLGDYVAAGDVVAELENSSQRAALLQAQGASDAAQASAGVSQTTLSGAQSSAVTALLSAYSATDNAVRKDTDPMFTNPSSQQPNLNVESSDSQSTLDAENKRVALSGIITRESQVSSTLSVTSDLESEFATTENELRQVRDFLDSLIKALNAGIATPSISQATIDTYKSTATTDRASITTALSALISAQQTFDTAQKNSSGSSDVSASSAALKQAQGSLAAAQANLEKTIIRAPISGTINSFSIKQGDFVSLNQQVLTVANNGALEIVTYITPDDATSIAVGNAAVIEGGVKGVVTRVAPAIDPTTKKIEVRVGIISSAQSLLNGQAVTVDINRTATKKNAVNGPITVPITALKIGASETDVFTVEQGSSTPTQTVLVPHAVTVGELLGDRVTVASGITPDMQIVVDARGLRPGEVVQVK